MFSNEDPELEIETERPEFTDVSNDDCDAHESSDDIESESVQNAVEFVTFDELPSRKRPLKLAKMTLHASVKHFTELCYSINNMEVIKDLQLEINSLIKIATDHVNAVNDENCLPSERKISVTKDHRMGKAQYMPLSQRRLPRNIPLLGV